MQSLRAWLLLRRYRGFARLFSGTVISMAGDWLTYVAVSVLVLEAQGGSFAVATILVAHTVPKVLVAPIAGWVTDRVDRRWMLLWASAFRGIVVLAMAGAAAVDSIFALQALLCLRMAAGAFVDAPSQAILPTLVPRERLQDANTLLGVAWSVVFALGVGAGGLLVALFGPLLSLLFDGVTFFSAAAIFWGLRAGAAPARKEQAAPALHRSRALVGAALAKSPVALANGGAWVALHIAAEDGAFSCAAVGLGALHLCRALGTGCGPACIRFLQGVGPSVGVLVGTFVAFLGMGIFALSGGAPGWLFGSALWGAGVGINWVSATTRLQHLCPDQSLGRWTALEIAGLTISHCVGGLLGAAFATTLGSWAALLPLGFGLIGWAGLQLLREEKQEQGLRGRARRERRSWPARSHR